MIISDERREVSKSSPEWFELPLLLLQSSSAGNKNPSLLLAVGPHSPQTAALLRLELKKYKMAGFSRHSFEAKRNRSEVISME